MSTTSKGGLPCRWVTGDEAYGGDPALATALRQHRFGYVLAVACSHRAPMDFGVHRADQIAASLPKRAWQRLSAGAGAKGFRYYDWAFVTLPLATDRHAGHHRLLIRRNRTTGELAFYRCWSPETVALAERTSAFAKAPMRCHAALNLTMSLPPGTRLRT